MLELTNSKFVKNNMNIETHRKYLENFMKNHHLNSNNWAKIAGISEGTLRAYLNKKSNNISLDTLYKLADSIGIPVIQLISEQKIDYNLEETCLIRTITKIDSIITQKNLNLTAEKKAKIYLACYKLSSIIKDDDDLYKTFDLIL